MIKAGDIVTIKQEWQDTPSDSQYIVREWNEDRGYISPINSNWYITPTELVREHMIEIVQHDDLIIEVDGIKKYVTAMDYRIHHEQPSDY